MNETEFMKEMFHATPGVVEIPKGNKTAVVNETAVLEAFGVDVEMLEESRLGPILLESIEIDNLYESSNGGAFRFSGRALKVGRKNKNGRRYSKEIVEKALGEWKSSGQKLTIMDGHPAKNETRVSTVVGSVLLGDIDIDGYLRYEATLANTQRGKDIQILVKGKHIGDVSLRSRGSTVTAKFNGGTVEDVSDLHFRGLDLVTEGSEENCGVGEILSEMGA